MTLRKRTLLILGVTLAGLMATLYASSSTILSSGYAEVEERDTTQNVQRVLDALSEKIAGLDKTTGDYAGWDETYAFIEDGNADYIKSNLSDSTFAQNELNLMVFVHASGRVVYSKAFDLQGGREIPLPQGLGEHLLADSPIAHHSDTESRVVGIVLLPEGPMLVASRPILTSAYLGPVRGALIMGRYLDVVLNDQLAAVTHLSVVVKPIADPQLPTDYQTILPTLSDASPIRVRPLSAESIAGYTLLKDIYGKPALVLRVDTPRSVYEQGQRSLLYVFGSLVAVSLIFALLILYLLEKSVLSRLTRLTRAASRVDTDLAGHAAANRSDELSAMADAESGDEIGALAYAFDITTRRLRELITNLEARVESRTAQLSASADVGRAVTSILDPQQLLREVVNLIADRFGPYYVAVFTLDEVGKYAVLREATGEAGRALKQRGHRLEVGGESMVGFVTSQRKPRIALDVGQEAVRFANPLLPDTRSEAALPLIVGDRVMGALDVQSVQEAAFDEASVAVLQGMADQVAVALSNAQSFGSVQASLQSATRLYELVRVLSAVSSWRDAFIAVGQAWIALPDIDRFSVLMISTRDAKGEPIEYEVAADWDTISGMQIQSGVRRTLEQAPLARLAKGDAPVVISDAGDPRLPESTRQAFEAAEAKSALIIPMVVRGRFEGLMMAVARQAIRFLESDVRFAQAVAEQLSVVISGLRASEETQAALERVELLNRRLSGEAWRRYSLSRPGGLTAESGYLAEAHMTSRVAAPIVVRGETLGSLSLEDANLDRQWSDEEWNLLYTVAGEVAQAVENARLIEETERLAERERTINQINARVRQTVNIDTILQTAVNELGRSLKAARVFARVGAPGTPPAPADATRAGDGGNGDHA